MRTYLLVTLDSEGASSSEVADVLESMGFRPHQGGYDFVYEWGRDASVSESLQFADRVQAALHGKSVYFRIESIEE
ncbi:MAG: hypothetical protein ACYDFT_08055 [Thermoplasmata archaeon]